MHLVGFIIREKACYMTKYFQLCRLCEFSFEMCSQFRELCKQITTDSKRSLFISSF